MSVYKNIATSLDSELDASLHLQLQSDIRNSNYEYSVQFFVIDSSRFELGVLEGSLEMELNRIN